MLKKLNFVRAKTWDLIKLTSGLLKALSYIYEMTNHFDKPIQKYYQTLLTIGR